MRMYNGCKQATTTAVRLDSGIGRGCGRAVVCRIRPCAGAAPQRPSSSVVRSSARGTCLIALAPHGRVCRATVPASTSHEMTSHRFAALDYVVFASMFVVSFLVGAYHIYVGRHHRTTVEYLLAGRQMALLPIALSLLASFLSSILILGVPAEIYIHGMIYIHLVFATIISISFSSYAFIPVFYRLRLTSVYEVSAGFLKHLPWPTWLRLTSRHFLTKVSVGQTCSSERATDTTGLSMNVSTPTMQCNHWQYWHLEEGNSRQYWDNNI